MTLTVAAFIAKWAASEASERANKDSYLRDLCDALGVPHPNPSVSDDTLNTYVFERRASFVGEEGKREVGSIDLYKEGHFILEAKQGSARGSKKVGTARRGTYSWDIAMSDAYGQALGYARTFEKPPPFIIVADLGYCFDLYATFDGGWNHRPFPDAQNNRIFASDFATHRDRLRAIFTDPHSLDPSKHAAKVTREVAGFIAELAKKLEREKHDPELVATFLMRCLFTMFAEDVGLLPDHAFSKALREHWLPNPASFPGGIEALWRGMNTGGDIFPFGKLHRFNGGLFKDPVALPLDKAALEVLAGASKCTWADVEPAIFGTLLERALDPKERHRLGAHFTPRAYVERLVTPTIEEPLREDWAVVLAQVRRLGAEAEATESDKVAKAKKKEAAAALEAFQKKLTETIVLDPACGTGNFLYVAFEVFKRLEGEVLAELTALGVTQERLHMDTVRVMPKQFRGIEIKPWAKEIAELVLWIGYLQWHFRVYGKDRPVQDPVLHDDHNIECRDAVLAYDGEPIPVTDEKGKPVTRWDGESYKKSPITGEDVPDETKTVPIYRYENPRKAEWPKADFIVGNPPFLGTKRMRAALGDGYVDALRDTYQEVVEDNADLVMYWWHAAAIESADLRVRRFGFITTNSVTQSFNRRVIQRHLGSGVRLTWAIPDHPWVDSETGASVRIAMSVGTRHSTGPGTLLSIAEENESDASSDGAAALRFNSPSLGTIHEDLRVGADVAGAIALDAHAGIASMGAALHGHGFVLEPEDAKRLGGASPRTRLTAYVAGRDLIQKRRERYVIDFTFLSEKEAIAANPEAFNWILERVRPERMQNRREAIRKLWWRFGWERPGMRAALAGLPRYIATAETTKHRVFQFLEASVLSDHGIIVIALDDAHFLGVLSSRVHVTWALAAGGRLGVGNDPRYNKTRCFEPFPFPDASESQRARIRELGESLDAHRKARQAEHPDLTITGMYNVLGKLRSGEALTKKDQVIHEQGLVSVLKKFHDDLDAAVFDAYGWPHDLTDEQILERLVALNAERAAEEKRGLIRWLRPEFQNPEGKSAPQQTSIEETEEDTDEDGSDSPAKPRKQKTAKATKGAQRAAAATGKSGRKVESVTTAKLPSWPKALPDQISAVRDLVRSTSTEWTAETIATQFKRPDPAAIESVLEALAAIGQAVRYEHANTPRYRAPTSLSTRPPPRA